MIRIKFESMENKVEELEIIGATLLSKEEYEKYKDNIPILHDCWWLKSPVESNSKCVYLVTYSGNVTGHFYVNNHWGIRPALILDLKSCDLKVGTRFKFGQYIFTIISKNLAICNDIITESYFRGYNYEKDANDYEKSNTKKIIDKWFNKSKKKQPEFFNKENIDFMLQNNDDPELKAYLLNVNHELGFDHKEEDDLSWLDMSDEEFLKYIKKHT